MVFCSEKFIIHMISLLGIKVFVIGGNGFIGNFIAAKMVQNMQLFTV